MQFKTIDTLSITECCERLNLRREDVPKALRELKELSETENLIVSRLNYLLNEDRTCFESCSTIEQYEKYIDKWTDGLHRRKAVRIVTQLKAQKEKEKEEKEEKVFYEENKNTIHGLEAYIKRYPNGRFIEEAERSRNMMENVSAIGGWIFLAIIILCFLLYAFL